MTDICFRDIQSYKLFNNLENVRWAPDVIFNLKLPKRKKENTIIISCIDKNNRLGLSDFSIKNYYKLLSTISMEYLKKSYKIIFVSFCNHQQDDKAANEVLQYIELPYRKNVSIIKYDNNISSFLEVLLQAEYIIGTRFHSIIISWLAQIPVHPIVYNIKTQNVIKDYGYKGKYSDINNLSLWSFNEIDYNHSSGYCFNCQNLIVNAEKQFYYLDFLLNRKG